ncbi:MAG TPA: DNRLRE domain-containing protein [Bacteroidota bacterium]|nr:DNRLRE domain-containing protein [Bacteroidota bacterium]
MKSFLKTIAITAAIAVILTGCSKEPSAVGIKLLPAGEKFSAHETTYAAFADTVFTGVALNGGGTNILVGNSATVECRALLRFDNTIPESLATVQIDSARLDLTVNYSWNIPIPAPSATYDIEQVGTPWSSLTVTADSLSGLSISPTASIPISVTSQDSFNVGNILSGQVDTSLMRKWISISADTADTVTPRFFSIALVTHPGFTNVGIWGFTGFGTSTPPSLTLIYEKNGVKDSVILNSGEGTFFALAKGPPAAAYLDVQGGLALRSKVRFSMKPVSDSVNKAIINNATMQLTLNRSASLLGVGSVDSVVAYFSGSETPPDSVIASYYAYGYRQDTTSNIYVFNVTTMAQLWLNSPSNNFGVAVRSLGDNASVDYHAFYTVKDTAHTPRILVTYTKR